MRSAFALLSLVVAFATLAALSCSLVEPKIGETLPVCGEAGAVAQVTGPYAPHGAAGPASTAPLLTSCPPDAGSTCDVCESASCCATRLDCYNDPLCACADATLDACLSALGPAAYDRTSPDVQRCWDDFAGVSAIAGARVACERAACAGPCGVP
jgi:hypothetical protein